MNEEISNTDLLVCFDWEFRQNVPWREAEQIASKEVDKATEEEGRAIALYEWRRPPFTIDEEV